MTYEVRQSVRAVLFDLDNTLADRDGAFNAWAKWFSRQRLHVVDAVLLESAVAELTALDASGRAPKVGFFQTLKVRYPRLDQPVEILLAEFRAGLLANLPPLHPGAARLLDALDQAAVPWGIVTNGSPTQINKVRALGLEDRARCVVISEVVGVRKPNPEIFRNAALEIGADPGRVLFVGDHPEADILGAAAVGMSTAWLRHGREWPVTLSGREPHYTIATLDDLLWIAEENRQSPINSSKSPPHTT